MKPLKQITIEDINRDPEMKKQYEGLTEEQKQILKNPEVVQAGIVAAGVYKHLREGKLELNVVPIYLEGKPTCCLAMVDVGPDGKTAEVTPILAVISPTFTVRDIDGTPSLPPGTPPIGHA